MSGRKFHRTIFVYEVLSEEPLGNFGLFGLQDVAWLCDEGRCSGDFLSSKETEVDGVTMARLLRNQGSEPEFFQLDDDGDDIEEIIG